MVNFKKNLTKLGHRMLSLAWYVYHVSNGFSRYESKAKFFASVVDVGYYGCHARLNNVTLPQFFDLDNPTMKAAMWNPQKNVQHLSTKNNNYAIILQQALKTHSMKFLKQYYGSGSVGQKFGLKFYDLKYKKLSHLIHEYDDTWRKDKYMCRVVEVIDNIRNSPMSFHPQMCIGLTRFSREKSELSLVEILFC